MTTINEAIAILTDFRQQESELLGDEFRGATSLGIEALRREVLFRERVPKKDWSLLPGETK